MNSPIDAQTAETVNQILHRIENHTDLLCHVTEREHQALVERDTLQLENIATDKRTLLAELEKNHSALKSTLGCTEDQLESAIEKLGITTQWHQNKARLQQAKSNNDRNGIMLNSLVARVQKELSLLTGQTTLSYRNEGSAQTHRDMGSLGRA